MGFAGGQSGRRSADLIEVGWPVHSLVSGGAGMSYPCLAWCHEQSGGAAMGFAGGSQGDDPPP